MTAQNMSTERRFESWMDRLRKGDASAKDEILAFVLIRFEHLASRMLTGKLRRLNETGDLMSEALRRLDKAIREVPLTSYEHFSSLVAMNLRQALLDMNRRWKSKKRDIRRDREFEVQNNDGSPSPRKEIVERGISPSDSAFYEEIHEAVEELDEQLRTLCDLHIYAGQSLKESAEVMRLSERHARRLWMKVLLEIDRRLELKSSHLQRFREEQV